MCLDGEVCDGLVVVEFGVVSPLKGVNGDERLSAIQCGVHSIFMRAVINWDQVS